MTNSKAVKSRVPATPRLSADSLDGDARVSIVAHVDQLVSRASEIAQEAEALHDTLRSPAVQTQ